MLLSFQPSITDETSVNPYFISLLHLSTETHEDLLHVIQLVCDSAFAPLLLKQCIQLASKESRDESSTALAVIHQLFLQPDGLKPARFLCPWISQARILEWVAISFSRGYSRPRGQTYISCIARRILYRWAIREAWIIIAALHYILIILSSCQWWAFRNAWWESLFWTFCQ